MKTCRKRLLKKRDDADGNPVYQYLRRLLPSERLRCGCVYMHESRHQRFSGDELPEHGSCS